MKPNQQHKALRQSGLFRPKVERDRRAYQRHPKHRQRGYSTLEWLWLGLGILLLARACS